jgi:hypothetical protein
LAYLADTSSERNIVSKLLELKIFIKNFPSMESLILKAKTREEVAMEFGISEKILSRISRRFLTQK